MVKHMPDGYHTLTPSLIVEDGKKAAEFYKKALGAKEIVIMYVPGTEKFMHAELEIGDSRFMLSEEMPDMNAFSPKHYKGTPTGLYLYVKDCDKLFDQAIKAGAKSVMPVMDMFWGDRCGSVSDPFGHKWTIATHKKDLTPKQMEEGAKKWYESMKEPVNA